MSPAAQQFFNLARPGRNGVPSARVVHYSTSINNGQGGPPNSPESEPNSLPFGAGIHKPISENRASPALDPSRPLSGDSFLAALGPEPDYRRDPSAHRDFARRVLAEVGRVLRSEGSQ